MTEKCSACGASTYEGLLLVLSSKPVASWEKAVGVGCVEPPQVLQVDTQPYLMMEQENNLREI